MSNKIYIEYKIANTTFDKTKKIEAKSVSFSNKKTLEIPMTSDITIEAQSEWSKMGDLVPDFFKKVLNIMGTATSLGGSASEGFVNMMNKLDMPMWQSSPPVKVSVQLGFFTKTDSFADVYDPVTEIVGLSILSRDPTNKNRFITPGINLANMNDFSTDSNTIKKKSKLMSFEIPGVIYLPLAMVESARPTFSNEITESSYPLWATVDLNIIGAGPATTDMFTEAISSDLRMVKKIEYGFDKIKSIFT